MNLAEQVRAAWGWLTASAQWHGADAISSRLAEHLGYTVLALLIAGAIALPFGAFIGHTNRGGLLVVGIANVARAIPTLGLVLLVITVTTTIGLTPVIIPLIALATPPILVNTYEGIRGVDPDVRDAAKGMGMTGLGVLFKAELPVAMPLILGGLRTATIQVVGTATIAAYAGIGGLGRYIVDGLARKDYQMVIGGAVLVALLSLVVQFAFVGARRVLVSPGMRSSR